MRYRHVCVEAVECTLPETVVTSAEIEDRLEPLYQRLGLPDGRLELMTGIRERRFFDPGATPGEISSRTAARVLEVSGIDPSYVGALVHGSVCRDQLEPATASRVHHNVGLPPSAMVLDVSNACLGLLNGMVHIADSIELGRIRAGIAVGTEIGRPLVEGTIDRLLADDSITRRDVKLEFASLTIGSGSAAVLLTDDRLSRTGHRLIGGTFLAGTAHHELCAGGIDAGDHADRRPRMATDSESLLHAGVELARSAWPNFLDAVNWSPGDIDVVLTHQVGRAHRKLLLEQLELPPHLDYPTVERFGNTGAAALPTAAALAIADGFLCPGRRAAWLGIGSGLNVLMLGTDWRE